MLRSSDRDYTHCDGINENQSSNEDESIEFADVSSRNALVGPHAVVAKTIETEVTAGTVNYLRAGNCVAGGTHARLEEITESPPRSLQIDLDFLLLDS